MSDTIEIKLQVSGDLKDHVESALNAGGFESADEFIQNLIQRDKSMKDQKDFEALKSELQSVFSAPESDYIALTADDIISRYANKPLT